MRGETSVRRSITHAWLLGTIPQTKLSGIDYHPPPCPLLQYPRPATFVSSV